MQKQLARAEQRLLRNDLAGAEEDVRDALQLDPDDAVAHNLLGLVHVERGEYSDALTAFSAAIRLRAPYPDALVNLALVCNRTGEHELALGACNQALAESPGNPLALVSRGLAWRGLGNLDEAKRSFELAQAHPLARFHMGHLLLLEHDLERGLHLYEERRALSRMGAKLPGTPWDGEPRPNDTLLVVPERSLGDFLLMSRFLSPLADRFAQVIVHAPAPLARLLATLDPRLDVVTSLEGARWDVWAPIMSLPWLLGVRSLDDVPTAPWIHVPAAAGPANRLRVGISWAGNPAHAHEAVRSTPFESIVPLLDIPDIEWVSLQVGDLAFEAEEHGLSQSLCEGADFLDTARVIAGLDMIIATESAVPNLSAAMGVPTCVLAVHDADWRWGGWYRGVTLCVQQAPGNWFGPIAGAATALLDLLDAAAANPGGDRVPVALGAEEPAAERVRRVAA